MDVLKTELLSFFFWEASRALCWGAAPLFISACWFASPLHVWNVLTSVWDCAAGCTVVKGNSNTCWETKRIIDSLHFRPIYRMTSDLRMPSPWRSKWTHQLMETWLKLLQVINPIYHSPKNDVVFSRNGIHGSVGRAACFKTTGLAVQIQLHFNPLCPWARRTWAPGGLDLLHVCEEVKERPSQSILGYSDGAWKALCRCSPFTIYRWDTYERTEVPSCWILWAVFIFTISPTCASLNAAMLSIVFYFECHQRHELFQNAAAVVSSHVDTL